MQADQKRFRAATYQGELFVTKCYAQTALSIAAVDIAHTVLRGAAILTSDYVMPHTISFVYDAYGETIDAMSTHGFVASDDEYNPIWASWTRDMPSDLAIYRWHESHNTIAHANAIRTIMRAQRRQLVGCTCYVAELQPNATYKVGSLHA